MTGGSNPTVRDDQGRLWPERIVADHVEVVEISGGDGPDRVDVGLAAEGGRARVDAGAGPAGADVVNCFGDDIGTGCELYGGAGGDRLRAVSAYSARLFGGSGTIAYQRCSTTSTWMAAWAMTSYSRNCRIPTLSAEGQAGTG